VGHPAKQPEKRHHLKRWIFNPYFLVSVGFVAVALASVLLWHHESLRPIMVGVGAGLAAFLAPIPGLLTPKMRGKWIIAIFLSALIGLGTWYSTDHLQDERQDLDQRLEAQHDSFESAIKDLAPEAQLKFELTSGSRLKALYKARQFHAALDLTRIISVIDPDNGHALYFAGEAHRSLHERTDMRWAFLDYLAAADRNSDAWNGEAEKCYDRPGGFCAERTAWIDHLMANDYYYEAFDRPKQNRADALVTAYRYEHHVLEIRPKGFYASLTMKSSCDVLHGVGNQLGKLGRYLQELDVDLGALRCP